MDLDISPTYYDKVLVAIAASLGGGFLAGLLTSYPLRVGVLAGALVATVCIYDAVFRNPPRPVSPRAKAAAVVWHAVLVMLLATTVL